ncbi:MAG: 16S rRNA processing protein RimM [Actinobacteria bacterium RBG_19FT_COMBO_36_27]|nr:MAG: 16S rRNA processing protein RimM [Actinobacteria bacterium RBG_19FT_COMBO_36_27]OGD37950.1 MAG: 16S rRNA processing protein RimM [Candidatus Atribacteria bacterium RBG_16_35_8]
MSEIDVDARLIGIIGKPHGVKGEVIVTLLTDYPNTIKRGNILFFDEKCTRKAEVENIKRLKTKKAAGFLIIKFKGIDNKNNAESFKGINVYRDIRNSPLLKENQYWSDDLIDCSVYTKECIFIGKIKDVEKLVANDNLVVEIESKHYISGNIKNNILYIPATGDYIENIDLKCRKVILKKIPEYI